MGDYRILGAGPAGLAAAITLAKAGHEVEVFERKADCGARFMGDLQALENWSGDQEVPEWLARIGIEANFLCEPFSHIVESNGSTTERIDFRRPMFYIVRRGSEPGSLDQGLKVQALNAGVRIHFEQTVPPEEADIVATGPVSGEVFAVAKGIVFDTDHENLSAGLLNDRSAVKGYSYLVVVGNYACLSSVLFDHFDRAAACSHEACRVLLEQHPMPVHNVRTVGGIAHFSGNHRFARNGSLYAGEAAGLQELLWGFGMQTALESGWLAASCLMEGTDYQTEASRRFSGRKSASMVNRVLWEFLGKTDYIAVILGLKRNARGILRSLYSFNPIQRLLHGPARAYVRRRYPELEI